MARCKRRAQLAARRRVSSRCSRQGALAMRAVRAARRASSGITGVFHAERAAMRAVRAARRASPRLTEILTEIFLDRAAPLFATQAGCALAQWNFMTAATILVVDDDSVV